MKNVRVISSAADPAMSAVRQIYQCAFPKSERKPIEEPDLMMRRSDYSFAVIEEHGMTIGFAILFTPTDLGDAALLEYLAVDAAHQGGGAGTALVHFVIELMNGRPILVEVESGRNLLCERRRIFYRRNGFRRLNGLNFICPLPNSPAMELMVINGPLELGLDLVGRWLRNIYFWVYQCDHDDLRLERILHSVQGKIEVE